MTDSCVSGDDLVNLVILHNKVVPVKNVCDAQTTPHGLESLGRSDAFGSGSDGSVSQCSLVPFVLEFEYVCNELRSRTDPEAVAHE